MNNLNPEGEIMPIDDDTVRDIKWAFAWSILIIAVFFTVLHLLNFIYPPAETSIRAITSDTIYIWKSGPNPLIMNDDSVTIYFQDDSVGMMDWESFDSIKIRTDSILLDTSLIYKRPFWYHEEPDFGPEIIYPEPEPKIIKIQRRIKNARSTGIQWE